MGRDRKPKHKLSRREGKDLFGTGGPSLQRRLEQLPGMHGRRLNRKMRVYAEQLREKQKVKRMYDLREGQFRNLMEIALRSRGQTGFTLWKLLEHRLDNGVYRLGLARTRPQARQFVNHGLVQVDGRLRCLRAASGRGRSGYSRTTNRRVLFTVGNLTGVSEIYLKVSEIWLNN